jgi:hypothetical protein
LIGLNGGGQWFEVTATDLQHLLATRAHPEAAGQITRLCLESIGYRLSQQHQSKAATLPFGCHPPLRDPK